MARDETCLVHLVWAPSGPAPLKRFLDSYRRHDPGSAHRLLVLFNGFSATDDLSPWRTPLAAVEHDELLLPHPLLDLAAYEVAVDRTPAERYCFVNSYSVVLAEDWLGALERSLESPGVGLVGASGSWGSVRSYIRFMLGFGGPYARAFSDRRVTNARLAAVAADRPSSEPAEGRHPVRFLRTLLEQSHGFVPFPAAHIRTNGFMIAGQVLARLRISTPRRKSDAYRLESGRESITAQIGRLHLRAQVIGSDGRAYEESEWPVSGTFWQGQQENLLIADNQTASYELGDSDTRRTLARYAWGLAAQGG
jgi:hypothetical protein